MKCLLFIITLFLGSFINVQGETDADIDDGDDSVSLEITKDIPSDEPDSKDDENSLLQAKQLEAETENPPEESEQKDIPSDEPDSKDDENSLLEAKQLEAEIVIRPEELEQSAYDDNNYDGKGDDSEEAESSGQESREKKKANILTDYVLKDNTNNATEYMPNQETMKRFAIEKKAGDTADLIGENQHVVQSNLYYDLGRRYEAQALKNIAAENVDYLTPEKAPPELVLLVAKESALLRTGKDTDPGSDFDRKNILRTGDYWNRVWKEEVKPKSAMRSTSQKKKLESIKARINPGTEFYKVVSRLKKISPQLLYIINKKQN